MSNVDFTIAANSAEAEAAWKKLIEIGPKGMEAALKKMLGTSKQSATESEAAFDKFGSAVAKKFVGIQVVATAVKHAITGMIAEAERMAVEGGRSAQTFADAMARVSVAAGGAPGLGGNVAQRIALIQKSRRTGYTDEELAKVAEAGALAGRDPLEGIEPIAEAGAAGLVRGGELAQFAKAYLEFANATKQSVADLKVEAATLQRLGLLDDATRAAKGLQAAGEGFGKERMALASLGLKPEDVDFVGESWKDVFTTLAERMKAADPGVRKEAMQSLFGGEDGGRLLEDKTLRQMGDQQAFRRGVEISTDAPGAKLIRAQEELKRTEQMLSHSDREQALTDLRNYNIQTYGKYLGSVTSALDKFGFNVIEAFRGTNVAMEQFAQPRRVDAAALSGQRE